MCGPIFHYGLGRVFRGANKNQEHICTFTFSLQRHRPFHIAKVTRRCTNKGHLLVVIADAKITEIPVLPSNVKREEIIATTPKGKSNMYSRS